MTQLNYQKGKLAANEPRPETPLSKTAIKQQMHELQAIGKSLVELSKDRLTQVPMSDDLREAVKEFKRLTANEARRRQLQYIGKIMRNEEVEPIQEKLNQFLGSSAVETAKLHLIERLRNQLLEKDEAITTFLERYPNSDVQLLRTLVRNARKEHEQSKPPKSYRELFQLIKSSLEAHDDEDDEGDDE